MAIYNDDLDHGSAVCGEAWGWLSGSADFGFAYCHWFFYCICILQLVWTVMAFDHIIRFLQCLYPPFSIIVWVTIGYVLYSRIGYV